MARDLPSGLSGLVRRWIAQLIECEDFADASDPVAAVHDLRVASRRLRVFVDAFEPLLDSGTRGRVKKPLRRVARSVRALRDWDVRLELLEARRQRSSTDLERAALEHLLERTRQSRDAEALSASKRLRRIDFCKVHARVSTSLDEAVRGLLEDARETASLVWKLLRPFTAGAVEAMPDEGAAPERTEAMHRFRIAGKRLRYAVELFEPVLGSG